MKITPTYLYDLLPAYYRRLDDEQGHPLRAFIEILAREAGIVEGNIDQTYENWFIETCEEWVVPYIGDLLGVRGLHEINDSHVYSRRAYVANTLAYRRRKGTVPVLEQLAQDITGWRARAVEFFQLLSTTQNLNHIRLHNLVTPDLKQMNTTDLIHTPFETASHAVDVGRISQGEGRYNIQNIGLYIWRLGSYPLTWVHAKPVPSSATVPDGAYTFSPLGLNTPLFNRPVAEQTITTIASENNVPGRLRRSGLHDELEIAREDLAIGRTPTWSFFSDNAPIVEIAEGGAIIQRKEITICNLKNWRVPASRVAIDPVLGRLIFNTPPAGVDVRVSYSYGFSADLGGGSYDRSDAVGQLALSGPIWHRGVSQMHTAVAGETIHPTLFDAIDEWNQLSATESIGLITVMDSSTYEEDLSNLQSIEIPQGKHLYIIAADWEVVIKNGIPSRPIEQFNPRDVRPHLRGDLTVIGTTPGQLDNTGSLTIHGMLLEGNIQVAAGNLEQLTLSHCTHVPAAGTIEVEDQTKIFELVIDRSICGPIKIASEESVLTLSDSIIDHKPGLAIDAPLTYLCLQSCTVWGGVNSRQLDASDCIFNGKLDIIRRQKGCVRFSYIPSGSTTPRRYRCQPDLALAEGPTEDQALIKSRVRPSYNSSIYGDPDYAQLAACTPTEIAAGAEDGAEMGVFQHLQQPQRITNLNVALAEYLRLGMKAGLIFVT